MPEAAASANDPVRQPDSSNSHLLTAVMFIGFVATGAATVLLSPLLPLLSTRWNLSDENLGSLFTCQFLGSMLGTLVSGQFIRRIGFGKTLLAGYLLMGLYVVEVWTSPWPWLALVVFMNGIGLGLVIPATNMAVSDAFPNRRASALNLLNLFWSVGAIVCPALLAVATRKGHLPAGLSAIAVLLFAVALLALRSRGGRVESRSSKSAGPTSRLAFVVLAMLFFLYIGSEAAVAGWLATYAKRTVFESGFLWMTAPSFFWAAMLLGRAVAPVVLRKISESSATFGGLLLAAVGIVTILLGNSPILVLGGAAVSGFGMSSVFPIFIAMVSHLFGESATRVSSYMFAMAALGGAVLPWLVGMISSHTGKLQVGLNVALIGTLIQVALILSLRTINSEHN